MAASVIALELLNIHPGILMFVLLLTAVLKKDKGDQTKARERQGAS